MKAFFLSRLLREKILLFGLTAIAAVMWLSAVSTRVRAFWTQAQTSTINLKEQRAWLGERERIERDAKAAIGQLDPSRTFDSVRLQAELDAIARGVGIVKGTSANDNQVTPGPQFSINTVRFTIVNVEWKALKRFYEELSKRAPYIGIEELAVAGNRANPSQLTASLRVSSVEISR